MWTRTMRTMLVGLALATGVVIVNPVPASAIINSSKSYSVSYETWDTKLAACVHVDVSGKTSAHRATLPQSFKGLRIDNPTMKLAVWSSCRTQYARGASSVRLDQSFSTTDCSMHPSFAFPWSVGFSPTCGAYVAMQNVTSYGAGSYFAQYNTGNPATWSGGTYNPCFDAVFKPTITVTIGTTPTSDTLTFTGKFCVR